MFYNFVLVNSNVVFFIDTDMKGSSAKINVRIVWLKVNSYTYRTHPYINKEAALPCIILR